MRLTEALREAFVRGVMRDTPEVDYREQLQKLLIEDAVQRMPATVRAVWDDPSTRAWITGDTISMSRYGGDGLWISVWVPCPKGGCLPSGTVELELRRILGLAKQQKEKRKDLERRLLAVAKSCTTRKALAAALPEFEKYLPSETPGMDRSVPVLANVVADFVRAGWPKDKKPPEAKPEQPTPESALAQAQPEAPPATAAVVPLPLTDSQEN